MKKRVRILSALLALAMAVAMCALTGCGDKHVEGSAGLEYTLSADGSYYIWSNRGTCTDKDVVIGNWYNDKPVKEAGQMASNVDAAQGTWEIDSLTVSDGVTVYAFASFAANTAKKITLPDGVEELPTALFLRCDKLETVVLGKGLKTINADVFMKNESLKKVCFRGTEEEWKAIAITDGGNGALDGAEIVYNYKD